MKKFNEMYVIGIDHGYGNMKTANCCFKTGLLAYDAEPLFTGDMLVYDGKYYLIGEGHKEFISDINSNAPTTLHSLYLSTEVIQQAVVAQDKVIRNIADNGISELAWGDRHNYEFMIDSSIGIEASVDIICHYIQSRKKIKQK